MSYTATGYYLDPNGRRGEFLVESPSSSRSQIERIVRNRYDAEKVIINSVQSTVDPTKSVVSVIVLSVIAIISSREQDLKDRYSSSSSSSYSSSSSSYRQPSYSGGGIGWAALSLLACPPCGYVRW